ncbi:hypothetical protein BD310DRAFT_858831 [Dichomitus squalens]|uniref:Protein kinase domain-containing protein n=1 Tax=Dichomitus squalens TaxID=114155 RepID=A0A4Q9PJM3_9APHY|nr:hypothetical protein BD310DRAFT_858831 [Dichomitus squalens]
MDSSPTGAQSLAIGKTLHTIADYRSSFRTQDLSGSALYDKQEVLNQLLGEAPLSPSCPSRDDSFIMDLVRKMKTDLAPVQALQEIDRIESSGLKEEGNMMPQLANLFEWIESEVSQKPNVERNYYRKFVSKDTVEIPIGDGNDAKAKAGKPDFALVEVAQPATGLVAKEPPSKISMRHIPAVVEVKAKSRLSPIRAYKDIPDVKIELAQGTDYGRLILVGRPFQLFAYIMFICGNTFCVARVDRGGPSLTPSFKLAPDAEDTDLSLFIRIVLRLIWEMSPYELGQDPSFALLPGQTYHQDTWPRFRVTLGSPNSQDEWVTQGHPLFVSRSFIGRGTWVWRTLHNLKSSTVKQPAILKTAWRTTSRKSEIAIYRDIKSALDADHVRAPQLPGMVAASTGGDVCNLDGSVISLTGLRQFGLPETVHDRVLHRVSLSTFGKTLWEYSSLEEFGRAMAAVVKTHGILFGRYGILHRDISAGNILIKVNATYRSATNTADEGITQTDLPPNEACGFLTDFEFASFEAAVGSESSDSTAGRVSVGEESPGVVVKSNKTVPHGDGLTGTALFMATEKLKAAAKQDFTFVHKIEHDIESFEWVILYTIYRHSLRCMTTGRLRTSVENEAGRLFSTSSIQSLYQRRCTALPSFEESISNLLQYVTEEQQAPELASLLNQISWDLRHRYECMIMRAIEPNLGFHEDSALIDHELYELDQARKKRRLGTGQAAVDAQSKTMAMQIKEAAEEGRKAMVEGRKAAADALQESLAGHTELNMWLSGLALASSDRSKGKGKASAQV